MTLPLYGFLQGDTIGLLIFAEPDDLMRDLADRLEEAASVRVRRKTSPRVVYRGKAVDPNKSVMDVGLKPLERFDVIEGAERVNAPERG